MDHQWTLVVHRQYLRFQNNTFYWRYTQLSFVISYKKRFGKNHSKTFNPLNDGAILPIFQMAMRKPSDTIKRGPFQIV